MKVETNPNHLTDSRGMPTAWQLSGGHGHEVLAPQPQHRPAPEPQPEPVGWRRTAAQCLKQHGALSPWERQFLNSLMAFRWLTGKQRACLSHIARRVLGG
jgi:hypothetical protein